MSELKPCPFCGKGIEVSRGLHDSDLCLFVCRACKLDFGGWHYPLIIKKWNTRPLEDAFKAHAVEVLAEELLKHNPPTNEDSREDIENREWGACEEAREMLRIKDNNDKENKE